LDRGFAVDQPSKVWVSDITYIQTKEGFLYLTTIIDLYDRKMIGWSLSNGEVRRLCGADLCLKVRIMIYTSKSGDFAERGLCGAGVMIYTSKSGDFAERGGQYHWNLHNDLYLKVRSGVNFIKDRFFYYASKSGDFAERGFVV